MRKLVLSLLIAATTISGFAQKTELGVQLNSGLFSFHGEKIKRTGYVFLDDNNLTIEDNQSLGGIAFGGRNGLNTGFGFNLKYIASTKLFFAAEAGLEYSKSRITLKEGYQQNKETAKGKANLIFTTVYLAPTIGYRLRIKNINIDLGIGVDVSRLMHSTEKIIAEAAVPEKEFSTRKEIIVNNIRDISMGSNKSSWFDVRPHANLKVSYKRVGAFCGYSIGTTDYKKGLTGSSDISHVNSRLWRFGLSYQFS